MKIISVFINKGGVGKSTLTYHLGNSLAELGHKVLMVDLDPQCNLTICAMMEETLHEIWEEEDSFIDDYERAFNESAEILTRPRSVNFDLLTCRLSLHKYENKIAERWI